MKDVGDVGRTLSVLDDQYREMKKRYDDHAGFKIRLQNNVSSFINIEKISKSRICCENRDSKSLEISTYPFYHSHNFARCLHVRCSNCGTTWVPSLDFSLNEYYKSEYALHVQPFRFPDGLFYSKENQFWGSETAKKMTSRADHHIKTLGIIADSKVLDIGPGVGITLSKTPTKFRYAEELDESCRDILRSELSVELIDTENTDIKFDFILASHIIEHLFIGGLISFLNKIRGLLTQNGKFLVEVPYGADQVISLKKGHRNRCLFEPHIISFSTYGLLYILKSSGFKVTGISLDKAFNTLLAHQQKSVLNGRKILDNPNLICICELE